MERLCERPGCSDPASVAYGMRAEDLVFWLDVLRDHAATDHGVLCRRHADSMIVPRGWTLDDLRDPDLHLFRPPTDDTGSIRRPRARRHPVSADHEQLSLGVDQTVSPNVDSSLPGDDEQPEDSEPAAASANGDGPADAAPTPWMPVFDTDDDLDGLLAARSPLLSRAFRGERNS